MHTGTGRAYIYLYNPSMCSSSSRAALDNVTANSLLSLSLFWPLLPPPPQSIVPVQPPPALPAPVQIYLGVRRHSPDRFCTSEERKKKRKKDVPIYLAPSCCSLAAPSQPKRSARPGQFLEAAAAAAAASAAPSLSASPLLSLDLGPSLQRPRQEGDRTEIQK